MNNTAAKELVGKWVTDPQDAEALQSYGKVTLEFTNDGRLIYTVHSAGKKQIILLVYQVQEGILITNQPSAAREERTRYVLTSGGKLLLEHDGVKSSYIREP